MPAANKQVHSVANVSSSTTWFALEDANHLGGDRFDMRINVVCCPTEGNWPLVLDDCKLNQARYLLAELTVQTSQRTSTLAIPARSPPIRHTGLTPVSAPPSLLVTPSSSSSHSPRPSRLPPPSVAYRVTPYRSSIVLTTGQSATCLHAGTTAPRPSSASRPGLAAASGPNVLPGARTPSWL